MLRERLTERLTTAMKAKDKCAVSTLRLILTAVKDRDIAARTKGADDAISDPDILQVLQTMIRQRHESIKLYEQGGRAELAAQEAEEITIIEEFLPAQLDDTEMTEAISAVVAEIGASSLKDMGKAMAELRKRHAGQMDFSKASAALKQRLGAG